jgi:hypothetical protein
LPQRASPDPQVMAQVLALQVWPWEHRLPQVPQFCASVERSTQAVPPGPGPPPWHEVRPEAQAHRPPAQLSCLPHELPQAPQLRASVDVFTQEP